MPLYPRTPHLELKDYTMPKSKFTLNKKICQNCQKIHLFDKIQEEKDTTSKLLTSLITQTHNLSAKTTNELDINANFLHHSTIGLYTALDAIEKFNYKWDIINITHCPCISYKFLGIHSKPPIDCPFLHKHINSK